MITFKRVLYKIWNFLLAHWSIFIMLLVIFTVIVLIGQMGKSPGQPPIVLKVSVEDEILKDESLRNKLENRFVGWVYDHSEKLSRGQCRQVVAEAMRTDKILLIIATICVESPGFNSTAISDKGCIGLMQINFDGNKGVDVNGRMLIRAGVIKEKRDLFEIGYNIRSGNFLLDGYLKEGRGSVLKALDRYLGKRDGAYALQIFANLAELYLLQEKVIREK